MTPSDKVLGRQFIYFAQAETGGLIKIGRAMNVSARIDRLQTGSPVPLRVLAVIPEATAQDETEIHQHFTSARAHGEWFQPVAELESYIAKLDAETDPLLDGDAAALERIWKVSSTQRVRARYANRTDVVAWVSQRRTASALLRDKRTAAELLVYMPDDLVTVEQAIESRKQTHGEATDAIEGTA